MPDEPNTINEVMSLDVLNLSKQDLDKIIAYSRKQRQLIEGGKKPKRGVKPEDEIDADNLLTGMIKKTTIKRRV